jgi:TPR repeat protein
MKASVFAVAALLGVLSAGAVFASSPTAAEIDRLRMHADAGRDDGALATLSAVAQSGNVDAQRALGEALLHRPDGRRAREGLVWAERAAKQGDARAMMLLGRSWLFGAPGLAPDVPKARVWFERADPERNPRAAYYLGLLEKAAPGNGDPAAGPAKAVSHFRFAAQQGMPEAMYALGNAYASGEGVDADAREAMRWYLRAAALDHPQAIQELAFAFARGDTFLPQSDFQAEQMRRAVEHALRHPAAAP